MINRFFVICIFIAIILILISIFLDKKCKVIYTIQTENGIVKIVNSQCKEGLPHTTDSNTIIMTESIWNSNNKETILKHERVHLDQKRNPQKWYEYYKREWDYECYKQPPLGIPNEYINKLRPNPDTTDSPWAIWRNRWVFFPIFNETNTLKNADIIVWDLQTQKRVNIPDEWKNKFCKNGECPNQYEHPHEISAVWITAGIMNTI